MKKMNRIVLPHGNGKKIARLFGVTPEFVSTVMNGKASETEIVKKIRHTAVKEYGGIVINGNN